MNLSFKIRGLQPTALLQKLKANVFMVFWLVFLTVIFFELLAVKVSVEIIFKNPEPPPVKKSKGVRIDFENYHNAVKRINGAASFKPSLWGAENPFKLK